MCGIAGIIQFEPVWNKYELEHCLRDSMAGALAHRGPDGEGVWVDTNALVGFAHRRLSIIELSELGAQPMWSNDQRFCITFNGEIYNYLELKKELKSSGARFKTETDTEVLLEAYRYFGADMLEKLDGMFAFVIYDSADQSFFMARDPFGEKPFYYSYNEKRFAFASELDALRAVYDFDDTILPDELAKFLCLQYFDGEASVYQGAKKLKAGHYALLKKGQPLQVNRYFEFKPSPELSDRSLDDWADELEEILVNNLSRRLRSDVPVGAFLSAGVDSSTVVALAARKLGVQLETFSIGFKGFDGSEHEQAAEIAAYLGVPHYSKVVSPDDLILAKKIGEIVDEPNGDSSLLPTYLVSEFARQRVKVALSGDGADELFGGYGRYMATVAEEGLLAPGSAPAGTRYYSNRILVHTERDVASLVAGSRPGLHAYLQSLRNEINGVASEDILSSLRKSDVEHYLPGAVLAKVDRMSMRHGLEVRTPFLNIQIARFAERLPDHVLIKGDSGKLILKQLASRYLPRTWLDRPKRGFGWPSYQWAGVSLNDQAHQQLIENRDRTTWWISRTGLRRWLNKSIENNDNNSYKLWVLIHLHTYLQSKGGTPFKEVDLLSAVHLQNILNRISTPILALSTCQFSGLQALFPGVDKIIPLYNEHDKNENNDWIKSPGNIIHQINVEHNKKIKSVVLLDKGECDDGMLTEFADAGIKFVVYRADMHWRINDLTHHNKCDINHYIPLVYKVIDESFYKFDSQRVLYDLYKHLPWYSAASSANEHLSDWLLEKETGLIRADTPLRAVRLIREIFAWGRFRWLERKAMNSLKQSFDLREDSQQKYSVVRKRIALMIGDLSSGGAERQICNLAVGLMQQGYDVCVFTLSPLYGRAAHYIPLLNAHNIKLVDCATAYEAFSDEVVASPAIKSVLMLLSRLPRFLQIPVWTFYSHLIGWRPDVLISFLDRPNLVAGVTGMLMGIPRVIVSFRNLPPVNFGFYEKWYDRYYRLICSSDRVIMSGNSLSGNKGYAQWLGVDEARIALTRNGVDFSSINIPSADEVSELRNTYGLNGSNVIIGVFRLSNEKRPDLFLKVCAAVLKKLPETTALIVGEGKEKQRLQNTINQLGLSERVLLVGLRNNVSTYIASADVILHTSEFEGTPNSLLEAQYLQKPVVTTPAGGAAEAVKHGVTGLVIDSDGVNDLAEAVIGFLCDKEKAASYGRNGRKFVQDQFSMRQMIKSFTKLFDENAPYECGSESVAEM